MSIEQTENLAGAISRSHSQLMALVQSFPPIERTIKVLEGTGGKVDVADLIAYQIGWGKRLIDWYRSGLRGETFVMPGEGFLTWDYGGIARHFYLNYRYDHGEKQEKAFELVVLEILAIIEEEEKKGRLDAIGVWPWCTLKSGKAWTLSKWVRVNTVAPYQRAAAEIKRWLKRHRIGQ